MLLIGEEGIGKSRLIEELIPSIVHAGGTVLHTKLYPESAASLGPQIARALRRSGIRQVRSWDDTAGSLGSLISELRRVTQIRPTLLIIEDIHLITTESLAELESLLEAVRSEMISLLCVARPVDFAAQQVIEQYVVDTIQVSNLTAEHIALLLSNLFDIAQTMPVAEVILETTTGNPLALRSALRGALRSGAIAYDDASGRWHLPFPLQQLAQTLRHDVALLSEGMVAHLTDNERRAAARLACLGEVFAAETAKALLSDDSYLLDTLTSKGIIAHSGTPATPMPGAQSAFPLLAFSHTILHNYLLRHATIDAVAITQIIGQGRPLYSIAPFRLIALAGNELGSLPDTAERAITRSIAVANALDSSPDWKLGTDAWNAASAIALATAPQRSAAANRRFEAELLCCQLMLMRRDEEHEKYSSLVHQLLALTDGPLPASMLEYRLNAFRFLHALGRRVDPQMCYSTRTRAKEFVAQHPELRFTVAYVSYLESAARSMIYVGAIDAVAEIERELLTLATSPGSTGEMRNQIRQIIAFHFLEMFNTSQELEQRLQILAEVEPLLEPRRRLSFLASKLMFMYLIGRMDDAISIADYAMPLFDELHLTNNYFYSALARACALGAVGANLGEIERELNFLCATVPNDIPNFKLFARLALVEMAIHFNDAEWLANNAPSFLDDIRYLRPEAQLVLGHEYGFEISSLASMEREANATFVPLVEAYVHGETDSSVVRELLVRAIGADVLRFSDLHEKRALLALVSHFGASLPDPSLPTDLHPQLATMIEATLKWCVDHKLPQCMQHFLECGTQYLEPKQLYRWRGQFAEISRERNAQAPGFGDATRERPRVTMLGIVSFHPMRGQPIPIRGSRLRTLLGLMIANRILHEPLTYREFSTIVAGNEDPDKARRTLNGVVFRLRELMGHDSVLTESETPELNLELVDVDLLEAADALRAAAVALREGATARAQRKIAQALEIVHGQVAFPSLYDEFFDLARARFENEIRQLILRTGRDLLDKGDASNAERLLTNGFAAMIGDEEIAELLCTALEQLDKHAEAERVRMRIAESND